MLLSKGHGFCSQESSPAFRSCLLQMLNNLSTGLKRKVAIFAGHVVDRIQQTVLKTFHNKLTFKSRTEEIKMKKSLFFFFLTSLF